MDLLDNQAGTTIIENLVAILLLGILVSITVLFFDRMFNSKYSRNEVIYYIQSELESCRNESFLNDSSFVNHAETYFIRRTVRKYENIQYVEITVSDIVNENIIASEIIYLPYDQVDK